MSDIGVIINSNSGLNSKSGTSTIIKGLEILRKKHTLDVCILKDSWSREDVVSFVKSNSFEKIVVAGGDGTVSLVAGTAIEHGLPLGVIPSGTFNHFAKHNSIPLSLSQAIDVIDGGHTTLVDVGKINQTYFLNFVSMGLYAHIISVREEYQAKGFAKWPAFFLAILKKVHEYPIHLMRITVKGKVYETRTPLLFIGNNQYKFYGLDFLGKQENLSQGYLYVGIAHSMRRVSALKLLGKAIAGRLLNDQDIDFLHVSQLSCIEESSNTVIIDGEVAHMRQPMEVRLIPRCLRVIVPGD